MEARGNRDPSGNRHRDQQGPPAQGSRNAQGGAVFMKCVDVEKLLDDLVDGSLSESRAAEVENHIASCQACRAAERSLKALLAEAAALEPSIEPPRDLWLGIARRIEAGEEAESAHSPVAHKNSVLSIRGRR